MNCPACKHTKSDVLDSRTSPDGAIRRRRRCAACNQRFSTYERTEAHDIAGLHNATTIARGEIAHLMTQLRTLDEQLRRVAAALLLVLWLVWLPWVGRPVLSSATGCGQDGWPKCEVQP